VRFDRGQITRIRKLDGSLTSLEEKGPLTRLAIRQLTDHPLPRGEGPYSMCSWCQPSPEGK
jgi:hypothetical protein